MKRTHALATIVCMVLGGTAYADHWHGGGHGGGRVVVRDHRAAGPVVVRDHRVGGPVVRDHRGPVVTHVRVTNGRYTFPGGVVRVYHRPVIREHYYNVHVRPPLIVESYDPVPGYVWMAGSWTWGGGEWVWTPGYWAVAEEPAPVVQGGIGISAGISIH
jgi:hypothetical protein